MTDGWKLIISDTKLTSEHMAMIHMFWGRASFLPNNVIATPGLKTIYFKQVKP